MIPAHFLTALANHVWQSTAAAVLIGVLALALRRNPARIRHWLWMIASAKFLFPISVLILVGGSLRPAPPVPVEHPAVSAVLSDFTAPFSRLPHRVLEDKPGPPVAHAASGSWLASENLQLGLMALWAGGFLLVALSWWRKWRIMRVAVASATQIGTVEGVPVMASKSLLEPGVFGIWRPVLLLPEGIAKRLTTPQLNAILAHEMTHIRRRDNLWAAIHMLVEAIFWFHPLVWWIGARMVEERERACDEAVLQRGNDPEDYAEGILNVCKLYLESPLACVSGVTGADLKTRILRIVSKQVARNLDFSRKLLLCAAGALGVAGPVTFGLLHVVEARAQTQQDLAGTWQGTLQAPGHALRTVLKVTKSGPGYSAQFYSIDQGGQAIPVTSITLDGSAVKYSIIGIDGSYEGKLSPDGKTITGTWTQGGHPLPLNLERATPETAWTIPEPPPRPKPMAADANPTFEVATIKPSKPGAPGKGYMVRGRKFSTLNTTLTNLITFAYGVEKRQVVGGPDWIATDKFDLDAQPDGEGQPNDKQWKRMVQKLLADRFQLKFHHEQRELPVYALVVAKSGPKLTKSQGDPNGLPGLFFTGLGRLTCSNANMNDFASVMENGVLDRPVVNRTGLEGRYDFLLKWTPDETQFQDLGMKVPPPSNAPDAPPNLFTAMQDELGLKLEPTKASVDVLVIDHLEKPSAN
ncbi:MAG TPA: M56 family metallopeptidase [Bryobacteraceae bacterium]|jgi:uncharacterized protein (TIGR03435 family)|nr:M56 family metallopeptidase [Bryobacteraceae bacterium]